MNDELKRVSDLEDDIFSEEKNPYTDDSFTTQISYSAESPSEEDTDPFAGEFYVKEEPVIPEGTSFSVATAHPESDTESLRYLRCLLDDYKISRKEDLAELESPFDKNENYLRIIRTGDDALIAEIRGYLDTVCGRIYSEATAIMEKGSTEDDFFQAGCLFEEIPNYTDAAYLARRCKAKSAYVRNNAVYTKAIERVRLAETWVPNDTTIQAYEASIAELKTIPDWEDATQKLAEYQAKLFDIKVLCEKNRNFREMKSRKKKKKNAFRATVITIVILLVLAGIGIGSYFVLKPTEETHTFAIKIDKENCEEQYEKLSALKGFEPADMILSNFVWMPSHLVISGDNRFFSIKLNYTYETALHFIEGISDSEFSFSMMQGDPDWYSLNFTAKTEVSCDESGRKAEETFILGSAVTSTQYEYNTEGSCIKEIRTKDGEEETIEHRYNSDGTRKKSVGRSKDNSETAHTYEYDANKQIIKETVSPADSDSYVIDYTYDEYGNILTRITTYSDGTREIYEYSDYEIYYIGK